MRTLAKLKRGPHAHWPEHRSGWGPAASHLEPLFADEGVLLDTFLEKKFSFDVLDGRADAITPYEVPWVGFLHHPPGVPAWHQADSAPQSIFAKEAWRQSLRHCHGLLVLSRWMERWVRERVDVPTLALVHPIDVPEVPFSWDAYRANPARAVVQVGLWLRRLRSIHELPVARLRKVLLHPVPAARRHVLDQAMERERAALGLPEVPEGGATELPYLPPADYDRLLSRNLVFVDLYDAIANNTVVECIARATPLLVNPLPSVVEYLGEAYPLYFGSLHEAARKADDPGCVKAAHDYLRELPKEAFSGERFLATLAQSPLYASL